MKESTGWNYWRVTPKIHLFMHLAEEQSSVFGSPARSWNYADEREIGRATHLARAVHPKVLNQQLMERYRMW